jgi:hypothetical protein
MIIVDGVKIKTEQELEEYCVGKSEETALHLSLLFNNQSPSIDETLKVKIYSFTNNTKYSVFEPPTDLDFITSLKIKLHRKSILVKGECTSEEYYETYDGTTYGNLIVREAHVFTRDLLGFAIKRDTTISWYMNNGSAHPTVKLVPKYYSNGQKIDEGKTRRKNLVDGLQIPCIGLISIAMIGTPNATSAVITEGRRFLKDYKTEFDTFTDSSNKDILSCLSDITFGRYITSASYTWIDSMTPYGITIRAYLINELTI